MRHLYVDAKHRLAIEILLIFVLPVFLLWSGVIPEQFRFFALAFGGAIIFFIMQREKWTLKDMGVITDISWKKDILPYLIFTAVGFLALFSYAELIENTLTPLKGLGPMLYLTATFLPVSFLQEFAYRGFLMRMLGEVYTDKMTIILYNATLFTLLHIIFPYPKEMLPLAAVAGIAFAFMYSYRKNLILVSVAHALLNFFAVSWGFFVIIGTQ